MAAAETAVRELLHALGQDLTRDDLDATPRRVARYLADFLTPPDFTATTFSSATVNQMVVVSDIRVWSLCEHHLLPFWCDVTIGYLCQDRILGLSKFARIAQARAAALQTQERLVSEIGSEVQAATGSPNVAVLARGEHTCLTMRGAKVPAIMTSSFLNGEFYEDKVRAEFMALALAPRPQ